MPSTYAHYRFGNDVLQSLSLSWKRSILSRRDLFDIGVHGPDLFFFYRPFSSNSVSAIGFDTHAQAGRIFFEHASRTIAASGFNPAALAYAGGLLTHFALDSVCHPYVEQQVRDGGPAHMEMEVSFDRFLLLRDGLDPAGQRLCDHVLPSAENAAVIAPFFPPATAPQVLTAARSFVRYNNWLVAPGGAKRLLVRSAMKLSGNDRQLRHLLIPLTQNEACIDTDRELWALYRQALVLAGELFTELENHLHGSGSLGKAFDHTFDEN